MVSISGSRNGQSSGVFCHTHENAGWFQRQHVMRGRWLVSTATCDADERLRSWDAAGGSARCEDGPLLSLMPVPALCCKVRGNHRKTQLVRQSKKGAPNVRQQRMPLTVVRTQSRHCNCRQRVDHDQPVLRDNVCSQIGRYRRRRWCRPNFHFFLENKRNATQNKKKTTNQPQTNESTTRQHEFGSSLRNVLPR